MDNTTLYKRSKAQVHRSVMDLLGKFRRLGPTAVLATFRWAFAFLGTLRRRRREERLTVAVDISSFWEPLTGIGWYLYRILEHLADRDDVRLRLYGPVFFDADPPPVVEPPRGRAVEFVRYHLPLDLTVPPHPLHVLLHKLRVLFIAADGNDVLFAPNYFLPGQFRLARGRVVAMIHDLGFMKVPETLQEATLEDLERKLHLSLRQSRHLLTPSEAVRREMIEEGLATAESVTAVHHGPGQLAAVEAGDLPAGVPEVFALHVGTIEPRKNLTVVLDAWRELHRRGGKPPTLVLSGRLGWKSEEILPRLEEGAAAGWLHRLGYVENTELAALYREAAFVVFPTLYEGFGLPAVEAQKAGTPLLCSDIPVLREIAGDAAAFVTTDSSKAWAEAVAALAADAERRRDLARRGEAHARSFSWDQAATATFEVWRRALNDPPR